MEVIADPVAFKRARERKRLSRTAVARKVNLSFSHIKDIERGRRQPSLSTAFKLAHTYGQPLDELVKIEVGE